jgi:hypothetical protein
MFKFLKKLFAESPAPAQDPVAAAPYKVEPPVVKPPVVEVLAPAATEVTPVRAKNNRGKFVGDNPATPENEAWVGGVAPAKKKPTAKKKPAVIKAPGKKKAGK